MPAGLTIWPAGFPTPKKVAGRIDYLAGRISNPKKVAGRIDYLAGRISNPKKVAGRIDYLASRISNLKKKLPAGLTIWPAEFPT